MSRTNFTFVITAYRSDKIIDECLKDLPKDIKKIVIDNSADEKLKGIIEKKYEKSLNQFKKVGNKFPDGPRMVPR